jgi:hypothetical protein
VYIQIPGETTTPVLPAFMRAKGSQYSDIPDKPPSYGINQIKD